MGNVACGIGTEGSRSCLDGAATCGLPVKRAVPFGLLVQVEASRWLNFDLDGRGREGRVGCTIE